MTPATIRKEIQIAAPIAHVWRFIGSEEGLRQWWGMDVMLEAKQGGRCMERGVCDGALYQLSGVVHVYEPPHRLELVMADEQGLAVWPTFMQIAITLSEAEEYTLVQIVHQVYNGQPVDASIRQPGSPAPQPLWAPPAILNQAPGSPHPSPELVSRLDPSVIIRADSGQSDHAWVSQQAARWNARLITLVQLVQQRKVSES